MKKETILNLLAYIFMILYIYTALSKWFAYPVYLAQLQESKEIGSFALPISIFIPLAELIAAVLLLFHRSRILGFWISLALMIAFTGYVASVLLFAPELPCTCGGIIQKLNWPQHLIVNIILTGLAIYALLLNKYKNYINFRSEIKTV